MSPLRCLSLALLLLNLLAATSSLRRFRHRGITDSDQQQEVRIEQNMNGIIDQLAPTDHVQDPPTVHLRPFDDTGTHPRFKAAAKETVAALNSLDLKSINDTNPPTVPSLYPRPVVADYGSIAAETVQRANYALLMLRNQRDQLNAFLKVQRHDLMVWIAGQKKVAQVQIEAQKQSLGKVEDEIAHLQRVYQDAMAKERSYEVQANLLISERQLQHTPPVMPVEVAAALSDKQYQEALNKLHKYQHAALQVMDQTMKHIQMRKKMAAQLGEWIKKSKETLADWLALQNRMIAKRTAETVEALRVNLERIKAVVKMSNDATGYFKTYSDVIQRMDLQKRVSELEAAVKTWSSVKPKTPYEEAQAKAYVVALKLEVKTYKKKIAAIPGTNKVRPPPSIWGVLSGFPSGPKVVFPEPVHTSTQPVLPPVHTVWIHPEGVKPGLRPPSDPSVRFNVPTREEHEKLPGSFVGPVGGSPGFDILSRSNWFPGAMSAFGANPTAVGAQADSLRASIPDPGRAPGPEILGQVPYPTPMLTLPSPPTPSTGLLEMSAVTSMHASLPNLPYMGGQQQQQRSLRRMPPQMPALPEPPNADLVPSMA